ncbi:MAG: M20/M25/M40 family metallo-hydrolase [Bacteroidia bacterium]|nr:MAG: M20/M25/M40 family metallo-hydrolase [Bacteroidia bacterium]
MKKYTLLLLVLFITTLLQSQTIINRDEEIRGMVDEISRENIEEYINTLVGFYTRHNLSVQDDPGKGIGASWTWVKSEMEKSIPLSGGRLSVDYVDYTVGGEGQRIKEPVTLKNVVATLKGSNPNDDRIFLISAHLDTRVEGDADNTSFAPGANDDGSGVAAILEMVRIMSAHPFDATIKFMIVTGEEHGLYGASHMASVAEEEKWNLVAMLNNDMIGNSGSSETLLNDNMKVRVFSEGIPAYESEEMARMRASTSGENDGKARQLARYVKEVGERYVDQLTVTLVFRNDRFGRGGDHTPFCRKGFTAVRITEFNENYDRTHKTPGEVDAIMVGDLPSGVDFEYVRKNAGVNLATLANLAMAPYEPGNVGISVSGLSNTSTLSWEKPLKGKEPAGYYLLMRETYQPLWEKKIFIKGTEVTVPYSKDNYFFAVQAVDDEGHESLPVFPGPARRRR